MDEGERTEEPDLGPGEPEVDEVYDDSVDHASVWRDEGEGAVPLAAEGFAAKRPLDPEGEPLRRSRFGKALLLALPVAGALIYLSTGGGDGSESREVTTGTSHAVTAVPREEVDPVLGLPRRSGGANRERPGEAGSGTTRRGRKGEQHRESKGDQAVPLPAAAPVVDPGPPTAPPSPSRDSFGFEQ